MDCELLIAGQGLAGTLVAWEAHWAGMRVTIIDPGETETASRVAAGIINPITGHRLAKSWRFDDLYPVARDFYRRAERELARTFYHPLTILRGLDDAERTRRWQRRVEQPDFQHLHTDDPHRGRPADPAWFHACANCFATDLCGFLEVEAFILASRAFFSRHHRVVEEFLDLDAIEISGRPHAVGYHGISAASAVFCLGASGRDQRFFHALPLRASKGEVLAIELSGCRENRIINRMGKWLLPTGQDRFLAGATYLWDPPDRLPSAEGQREITQSLGAILTRAPVLLGHRAGLRPIIRGSRPVLGRHPAFPGVCVFNGLGSKGVVNGPYFANLLIRHLHAGSALESDTDVRSHL
jgi:glycine/D-amino acid oxidase-like deaminating enzyme